MGTRAPVTGVKVATVPKLERSAPSMNGHTKGEDNRPPKPPSAHIEDIEIIPLWMRELKAWVCWQWRWKPVKGKSKAKWDKPPIDPATGHEVNAIDPINWMTFDDARQAALDAGLDGIGIALGSKDERTGIVAVDLDNCIDDQGVISELARRELDRFDSYAERTPSTRGLRILIRGAKPGDTNKCSTNKHPGIELYQQDRYITVTGRHLEDTPTVIAKSDLQLAELYFTMWPELRPKPSRFTLTATNSKGAADYDDNALIAKIRASKQGPLFSDLFDRGATSRYGDNHSEADEALLSILAFWTAKDAKRMERIFNLSALGKRDKWTGKKDYRDRSIKFAIDNCKEVFGENSNGATSNGKPSANGSHANGDQQTAGNPDDQPIVNKQGFQAACLHNTLIWLRINGPANVWYDTFRHQVLIDGKPISDEIVIRLTAQIESGLKAAWSQEHVRSAVIDLAHQTEQSSLSKWLHSLRWDGVERMPMFFTNAFGCACEGCATNQTCEELEYRASCAKVFFISAVARSEQPGCQADVTVVLIGDQGIRKSTGMAALCPDPEWFADDLGCDLFDRKAGEGLRGKWLVEFSEFSRINRATLDVAKAFLTRRSDYYRPAYGRIHKDFPRTCVFVGTTNDDHPLHDRENRRFMPIRCTQAEIEWIRENRDQLWAEALARYQRDEKWWVDCPTLSHLVQSKQEEARQGDYWESLLSDSLMQEKGLRSPVTLPEVLSILKIENGKLGKSEQTRIGIALRTLGYSRKRGWIGDVRTCEWTL
jgi:hypothetical protein